MLELASTSTGTLYRGQIPMIPKEKLDTAISRCSLDEKHGRIPPEVAHLLRNLLKENDDMVRIAAATTLALQFDLAAQHARTIRDETQHRMIKQYGVDEVARQTGLTVERGFLLEGSLGPPPWANPPLSDEQIAAIELRDVLDEKLGRQR
jgi:hypothetical protein